jgi:hypothetical protein
MADGSRTCAAGFNVAAGSTAHARRMGGDISANQRYLSPLTRLPLAAVQEELFVITPSA